MEAALETGISDDIWERSSKDFLFKVDFVPGRSWEVPFPNDVLPDSDWLFLCSSVIIDSSPKAGKITSTLPLYPLSISVEERGVTLTFQFNSIQFQFQFIYLFNHQNKLHQTFSRTQWWFGDPGESRAYKKGPPNWNTNQQYLYKRKSLLNININKGNKKYTSCSSSSQIYIYM